MRIQALIHMTMLHIDRELVIWRMLVVCLKLEIKNEVLEIKRIWKMSWHLKGKEWDVVLLAP